MRHLHGRQQEKKLHSDWIKPLQIYVVPKKLHRIYILKPGRKGQMLLKLNTPEF